MTECKKTDCSVSICRSDSNGDEREYPQPDVGEDFAAKKLSVIVIGYRYRLSA